MFGKEFSDEYIRKVYKMWDNEKEKGYGFFLYREIRRHGNFDFQFNDELLDFLKGKYGDLDGFHYHIYPAIRSAYYNGKLNLDRWLQEAVYRDLISNGKHYSIYLHVDVAIMLYFRYMLENYITDDLLFVACIIIMNDIQSVYGYDLNFDECQKLINEYKKISLVDILNDPNILKQTVLKCFPDLELKKNESNGSSKLDLNKDYDVNLEQTDECKMKPTPSGNKSMTGILSKEGYFVATNN